MAELVAIATGSAANLAGDFVKKLGETAWKKIKNPTDLDRHMKDIHFLKSLLEGLLQRIDPSKVRNDNGKHVIEKLQDVKDNLDSLLNMGAYITEQKEIMGRSRFAKVRYLISSRKQLLSPSKFARKYKAVVDDIESIEQHSDLFRSFFKESNHNQGFSIDVVLGPILTEVVIGRDRDRDNIIALLCGSSNGQESVSVAAIVGVGGQGKTTLAKYVCNDQRVKGRFDVQLWVSFTPESDFTNVVGDILEYANGTKPLSLNCGTAQLHPQFLDARSKFEGKTCLIVLDNVWDQDKLGQAWGRLKDSLGDRGSLGACESTVLITTRSMAVAKIMDTPRPYVLNSLAESDSLILFQRFAKGQDPELEGIGKKIVELCPKVPLVVKNIGCQLKQRRTCDNWLAFKEKLASARAVHMDDEVLETLKVSYNQLMTEKLKNCAAYCSLFPTRTFSIQRMVLYWMALGFVMSEEDGEECMFNLVDRGFSEGLATYLSFKSTITLHDVMYDLISSVGKSKHQSINGKTKEINKGVCHVSLADLWPTWDVLLSDLESEQQLQSIVMTRQNNYSCNGSRLFDIEKIISKFPHLKVLEVRGQRIGNLPRSIGGLHYMRHLDLSRNPLHKLPNSFKNLFNLLSLDLSECENLEELPKDMGKLVKLRHLWIDGCNKLRYMPKGFGNLTELRTLDMFILGEKTRSSRGSKSKIEAAKLVELGHLNNLKGPLRIVVGGQSKDLVSEAREAHLEKKRQLIHLEIVLEKSAEEDEEFLEALQPCGDQLEVLIISNYGGKRLPSWITHGQLHQNFPKLEKLRLFSSGVKYPMKGIFQFMSFWIRAWLKITVDNNAGDWIHQWVPGYSRLREQLEMGLVELQFPAYSTGNYLDLQVTSLTIQKELAPRFSSGGQQQPDVLKSYFANLEILILNVPELEVIPELFRNFSSLLKLMIKCPKLKGIPDWIHNLSCLEQIYIEDALEMKALPDSIGSLTSLRSLSIMDAPEMKALPDSIGGLTSLLTLSLRGFSGLESLPHDQISNLPELYYLEITPCSKALFEKCKEPTGDYWPHLQHLKTLLISSSEGDRFHHSKGLNRFS